MKREHLSRVILSIAFLFFIGFGLEAGITIMHAQSANLVANASFETGGASIGQDYNQNGWTFFVIEEPVKGVVATSGAKDGSACFEIQTDDGRGFLHSDPFAVSGSSVNVRVSVKGSGEGAVEILWWKKYDDDTVVESDHHRDVLKTFNASASWQEISGTASVPADAKFAYIRLVAKKANVSFDAVSVSQ